MPRRESKREPGRNSGRDASREAGREPNREVGRAPRPETAATPEDAELKRKLLAFAADFPFFRHMGLEVEDMGPGFARVSVELVNHLRNPNGQMHGGVIATLVDMSITQAMLMTETYQRVRETRGIMTNIDLRMKYLRAVGSGRATVESRIVHEGRRVVHAASTVTDDEGRTVALGDATLMIVLGEKREPKAGDTGG